MSADGVAGTATVPLREDLGSQACLLRSLTREHEFGDPLRGLFLHRWDIRAIQEFLRHDDVATTMICTRVPKPG